MKSNRPFFVSVATALATLAAAFSFNAAAADGEVIVAFKPQADTLRKHALAASTSADRAQAVLADRAAALSARVGRTLQAGAAVGERVQVMHAPGMDAATLARQLAADPDVLYAVPNGKKRIRVAPNDPLYAVQAGRAGGPDSGQWYLRAPDATIRSAIDIEAAWARTRGSANVVVAVLDTGVRFEHPDLGRVASGGKLLDGYDFINDGPTANDGGGRDADPSDPGDWEPVGSCGSGQPTRETPSSWHGTSTSSIVGAATDNNTGMAGTAPGVQVLPVRVLGRCGGFDSDIIAGMRWAAGIAVAGVPNNPKPAKILNMSLGGSGACSAAYQDAVNEIIARGVTIVAAAGNSAGGPVSEPANCRGVIGVVALRHAGTKVGFSDLGSEIAISAPGGNCINTTAGSPCIYPILAASNTGTQGPGSSAWSNGSNDITVGTSFSSPLVAGVAALMVSQTPALTPQQLRTALQASARPFPTSGADNGPNDPTPVNQCTAPQNGVEQLQCYCNTQFCGAGMLDAGRAVAAAGGTLASISVSPDAPEEDKDITLSAVGSLAATGTTITAWKWAVENGGGIVGSFASADNASTATVRANNGGTFTVRLTVTDSGGGTSTTTRSIDVKDTTFQVPLPPVPGGGGGGGAASLWWVLGVALAALVLTLLKGFGSRPVRSTRVPRRA